jgi:hypothetical protein
MKKNIAAVLVSMLSIAMAGWLIYPRGIKSSDTNLADQKRTGLASTYGSSHTQQADSWPGSPFGDISPQHVLQAYIADRQQRMESKGYGSPPKYYEMDLRTLQKLARDGDGDAMLQLAEQYYEEAPRLHSDPAFPTDKDPRLLARQYLAEAVGVGFSRAATLLAKRHLEQHNVVDAYVWRRVSEELGDGNNRLWGKDVDAFATLTVEQKHIADARFTAEMRSIAITLPRSTQRYHQ